MASSTASDHRLGPDHPLETELRVVGPGGVEVDIPDPEEPVEHALLVVHVLDAVKARLLHAPPHESAADAQPLGRDQVLRRDTAQVADDEGQPRDDRRPTTTASGHESANHPRHQHEGRHDEAADVEGHERPPGGSSLIQLALAAAELHFGTSLAPRGRSHVTDAAKTRIARARVRLQRVTGGHSVTPAIGVVTQVRAAPGRPARAATGPRGLVRLSRVWKSRLNQSAHHSHTLPVMLCSP